MVLDRSGWVPKCRCGLRLSRNIRFDSGGGWLPRPRSQSFASACFETFAFPSATEAQREAIGAAAGELDRLRNNWLNPPEWTRTETLEFPGSTTGPWARFVDPPVGQPFQADPNAPHNVDRATGQPGKADLRIGTVRYPRLVPRDAACAEQLKKRTLTNLYNQRPTWLDLAHRKLDAAVFAAYGWSPTLSDDELLAALLRLNLERAGST